MNTTRDGINVSDGRFENGAWSMTYSSPDLVEEVKVVVAPVDAETSRGSGQVQHGDPLRNATRFAAALFWANHNSALDANSWFNNFNGVEKNYDNRNQFGGRLGGPIIKNKTFFFALFEGQRDLKRENATGNTLTAMARQGIFRYFPGADNANANNANSDGRSQRQSRQAGQRHRRSGGDRSVRQLHLQRRRRAELPDVSAIRCVRRFNTSPYMQETLRRMPLPNEFTGGDGLNTAVIRFTRRVEGLDLANGNGTDVNRDQYNLRIDHNFNANHKLSLIGTKEKTWGACHSSRSAGLAGRL